MIKFNFKNLLLALLAFAAVLLFPSSTRAVSLTQKETSVVLGGAKQLVVGVAQNSTTDDFEATNQEPSQPSEKRLKQAELITRIDQKDYDN